MPSSTSSSYTLFMHHCFKNSIVLEHLGPLDLSQFECDVEVGIEMFVCVE